MANPKRVVILGGAGFIGKHLQRILEQETIPFLSLTRTDLDLTQKEADVKLTSLLRPIDTIVFLATITPDKGKGIDAFLTNIRMAETVCRSLTKISPAHLIYISSDTVYPLHGGIISEESSTDPENLFGAMHLARESMLRFSSSIPFTILRTTLIYGAEDTHNSYGPNRLRRVAQKERKITLFGNGEEHRDHIFVRDVADLISKVLLQKTTGIFNLATGRSISYFDLAHKIAANFEEPIQIITTPRNTPITHRHFDVSRIYKTFPSFRFTSLEEGIRIAHQEEFVQPMRI